MNDVLDFQEGYVSTLIGIMLLLVIIQNNRWRFNDNRRENTLLLSLVVSVFLACILDCMVFYLDGKPGAFNWWFLYVANSFMYVINIALCCCWLAFTMEFLVAHVSKLQIRVMGVVVFITAITMLYNFYDGSIFYINEYNQYVRGPNNSVLFWLAIGLIGYFLCVYEYIVYKTGGIQLFPISSVVGPLLVGIVVQMFNYGVLVIWAAAAVSITGVILGLQNEMIFRDNLTGVYNRHFFDNINNIIKKKHPFGLMFLDLNEFKFINDQYGHEAGDEVLKTVVKLMRKVVGFSGTIIRYGGDEFIILINSEDEQEMQEYVQNVKDEIIDYNLESGKPYNISVAAGYCITSLEPDKLMEAVNVADKYMYIDKENDKLSFY